MIKINTLCGFGVCDVDYAVQSRIRTDGFVRKVVCPYYEDWSNMVNRTMSSTCLMRKNSYNGTIICEEWRYLSNFIKWVDSQPNRDWQNCSLDKDLLSGEVKIYSPDTCVYLNNRINLFLLDSSGVKGSCLLGVSKNNNKKNPYKARINDLTTNNRIYLGSFSSELEAHKVWQAKKHEFACMLADMQADPIVANALRERYSPDKDWTKT